MKKFSFAKRALGLLGVFALCAGWFVPAATVQAVTRANFTLKVVEDYSRIIVQAGDGAYYLITTSNGCYFTDPPDGGKTLSLDINSKGAPSGILYDTVANENCSMGVVSELTFVTYGLLAANGAGTTATVVSKDVIPVRYALTFTFGCSRLSSMVGSDIHMRQAGLLNGTGDTLYLLTKDQNCVVNTVTRLTPSVAFSAASGSIGEAKATVSATVQLSFASTSDVTVAYATANGTATSGDYTATSGTLTIAAGSTTGTISVPIKNDKVDEANETFSLTLSSPTNASLGATTQYTVTIIDNDNPPIIVNEKLAKGKIVIENEGEKKSVTPFGSGYKGTVWSKRVEFDEGDTPITVVVPTSSFGQGTIKVYDETGKVLQNIKPFGIYITKGATADIITQPTTGKVYAVFGFKETGYTVRVYELTSAGLVPVTNLAVVAAKDKGTIIAGFRKLYGSNYGLVAMKVGNTKTLHVWKISSSSKFTQDTTKATLAKLKVTADKITLK